MDKGIIIPDNHVAVRPSVETWAIISPYLKSAPFRAVTDANAHASLIYATTPIVGFVPKVNAVYEATIVGCEIWHDEYMGINDLIVTLDSQDLITRNIQIQADHGVQQFYPTFVPHFTLAYDIPPYGPRIKWFINEMVTLFNGPLKGQIIRFGGEYIESTVHGSGITEQNHIDKNTTEE